MVVAAAYLSYRYFNVMYHIVTLICMHALNHTPPAVEFGRTANTHAYRMHYILKSHSDNIKNKLILMAVGPQC